MKIDVYTGTLSIEFGDTFVMFNIFEALKHPAEDHSIFSTDTIDMLIEKHLRMSIGSAYLVDFVEISNVNLYLDHIGLCMTRSSTDPLYAFDPEIELTLRRIRKHRNTIVNTSSNSDSIRDSNLLFANELDFEGASHSDVVYQLWCIQYPQLEPAQTYEIKSGMIHLFPKFHGLAGEDPHKHLKEFHVVCSTMRPQGIPEDYIKMKAIPFSLDGVAKEWLYLQPALFNTWGDMKCTFLEKFFPTSRTVTIRKEICGIRQHRRNST
ncbi:hypothetical protein CR513_04960, partial [Mucuna pruriens]